MAESPTRRDVFLLAGGVCLGLGLLVYLGHAAWMQTVHSDSCKMIGGALARHAHDHGPPDRRQARAVIASLIRAGVVSGRIEADGAPTDLNGNPYRVSQTAGLVTVAADRSPWEPLGVRCQVRIRPRAE
jgi:hypothetical protein